MTGFAIDVTLRRSDSVGGGFELRAAFDAPRGVTVVFGSSGAGKSTLLLAILGALRPGCGRVVCCEKVLFDSAGSIDLPIRERRIGMVFQDALLFPHLSAEDNVAFALRGTDRRSRARIWLDRVGAGPLAEAHPSRLSGGERQRVALARCLAADPAALLLDEPFSALDARARESLGALLLELQAETGIPFLHVTHDLGEAMRMGDRLVLLDRGSVIQSGPPAQVVAHPGSMAAARAVGTENLFRGTVLSHSRERGCTTVDLGGTRVETTTIDAPTGARVALGLRAEDALVSLEPLHQTSARNVLQGEVESVASGDGAVEVRVVTPVSIRVLVTPASVTELALAPGRKVWLLIKAAAFHRLV